MKGVKWTTIEVKILKEEYENGVDKVFELINYTHSKNSIRSKAQRLKLKVNRIGMNYNKEELKKIIKESFCFNEVFEKLGKAGSGSGLRYMKRYINENHIDTSHFAPYKNNSNKKIPLSAILVEYSTYNTTNLKNRLYQENIKFRKCELCGQGEKWRGSKISLILDHINGNRNDHRIGNLQIVCPNCNATLPTHCKGNRIKSKKKYYCSCGSIIHSGSKMCMKCSQVSQRKVKRPSREILLNNIEKLGFSKTGKKYGVTSNTIRKWCTGFEV